MADVAEEFARPTIVGRALSVLCASAEFDTMVVHMAADAFLNDRGVDLGDSIANRSASEIMVRRAARDTSWSMQHAQRCQRVGARRNE